MGDRINYYFKRDDISPTVKLYSHYGGSYAREDIKLALKHARPRWNDPEYGTRMMIGYFIHRDALGELGFGISAENPNYYWAEENGYIVIDFDSQKITIVDSYGNSEDHSFEDFVNTDNI